jgi:hypothetical protein
MMRSRAILPALISFGMALLLIAAAPVEAPSLDRQIAVAAAMIDANKNEEALALLDPLLPAADTPGDIGRIETLRSFALARLGRVQEAHKSIEIGVASNPAPTTLVLRQLFLLRAFDGDPKGAAETLELIAASDPKGLSTVPSEILTDVMRAIAEDKTRSFNLDYALISAGWEPADVTLGDIDWLRLRLITQLVERDRLDDAQPIIDKVLSPVVLVRMAIDRRFESLWPALEKRLGPSADTADAAYVAAAKARFDKNPKSLIARLGYAEALNIASREPEAMAIADVAKTPEELAALSNREIWLVNLHAALLGDAGKADEAMARMAALNASPLEGRPALAGTIVNEAVFAESLGRSQAALDLASAAETRAGTLNEYGQLALASVRTCALTHLGRKSEALEAAAPVLAKPGVSEDAYLQALLCLGRTDAAAAAMIKRLTDPDKRMEMLFDLQPFLIADRDKDRDKRLRADYRALKARPDVKAAFLKAGRDLPAAVAPPR